MRSPQSFTSLLLFSLLASLTSASPTFKRANCWTDLCPSVQIADGTNSILKATCNGVTSSLDLNKCLSYDTGTHEFGWGDKGDAFNSLPQGSECSIMNEQNAVLSCLDDNAPQQTGPFSLCQHIEVNAANQLSCYGHTGADKDNETNVKSCAASQKKAES